jgi:S-adenosylmethionine:diacylglycerol 3-amino-3-carboxypropyl transferase
MRNVFTRALSLGLATLREIFDESAYARFLARRKTASSREAYSAFLHEQARAQSRRHRCC